VSGRPDLLPWASALAARASHRHRVVVRVDHPPFKGGDEADRRARVRLAPFVERLRRAREVIVVHESGSPWPHYPHDYLRLEIVYIGFGLQPSAGYCA
jgi:hypothetical protein